MKFRTVVDVAAASEPVSLALAKEHLRIESDFTLDDSLIAAYISAARERVESYCNRFFTAQTVSIVFDGGFPLGGFFLPYSGVSSVAAVTYIDSDNVTQSLDGAEYTFNTSTGYIQPVSAWPVGALGLTVQVVTAAPSAIESVKAAILLIVADLYEHRTENVAGVTVNTVPAAKALLYPFRENLGV